MELSRTALNPASAKGELEASILEAHEDHVFGVPIFVFRGELLGAGPDGSPRGAARGGGASGLRVG